MTKILKRPAGRSTSCLSLVYLPIYSRSITCVGHSPSPTPQMNMDKPESSGKRVPNAPTRQSSRLRRQPKRTSYPPAPQINMDKPESSGKRVVKMAVERVPNSPTRQSLRLRQQTKRTSYSKGHPNKHRRESRCFGFKLPEIFQDKVDDARAADKGDAHEVLVEDFSIRITRHDMRSLRDGGYLNDAVIYFFMLVCVRVYLKSILGLPPIYPRSTSDLS